MLLAAFLKLSPLNLCQKKGFMKPAPRFSFKDLFFCICINVELTRWKNRTETLWCVSHRSCGPVSSQVDSSHSSRSNEASWEAGKSYILTSAEDEGHKSYLPLLLSLYLSKFIEFPKDTGTGSMERSVILMTHSKSFSKPGGFPGEVKFSSPLTVWHQARTQSDKMELPFSAQGKQSKAEFRISCTALLDLHV